LRVLKEKYDETPVAAAIADNGEAVIELTLSPNGDTWTILVDRPDGTSCVLGSGRAWLQEPPGVGL
jgi:hypothetical protein